MICPICGLSCDIIPPEDLQIKRMNMMEVPVVTRPEPSKCSRCDYEPQDIETGVFLNR